MSLSTLAEKLLAKRTLITGAGLAFLGFTALSAISLRTVLYHRPDLLPVHSFTYRPLTPTAAQRVGIVYNPSKARAQPALQVIYRALSEAGWQPAKMYETTVEDGGISIARQAVDEGAEIVLVVGGDGTVGAVAAALRDTDIPMGIVPMGTGNLLARNLGLDVHDIPACVNIALFGSERPVDMVRLNTVFSDGSRGRRDFLVMGGAGFDALVMTDTDPDLKSKFGSIAYFVAAGKHLLARRKRVRITIDGQKSFGRKMRGVLIANCGEIQGGINLASTTTASDGKLEVIVLSPRTLLGWLNLVIRIATRQFGGRTPVLEHIVGEEVHLDFLKDPQPVEVDGDIVGEAASLHATVHPKVLNVKVYKAPTE
ncbi:diacylglycerol kinase family protein [Rothia sp. ZJ932]|uniref:diacylglycerol/lipid kinase family protein n=1 Tax=Rothia sp. ZJ932 TaxID=2810516 RepID=UPI001967D1B8|nr:diacylglycerol kinase family protein [Rothia sp. ZJ932]QRZ61731.1 NAD(+)/NADH kinase [Rothia sp. ZJ932]